MDPETLELEHGQPKHIQVTPQVLVQTCRRVQPSRGLLMLTPRLAMLEHEPGGRRAAAAISIYFCTLSRDADTGHGGRKTMASWLGVKV